MKLFFSTLNLNFNFFFHWSGGGGGARVNDYFFKESKS